MAAASGIDDNLYVDEDFHEPGPLATFCANNYRPLLGTAGVVAFLGFWEWVVSSGHANPLFTSSPSRIVHAFAGLAASGELGAIHEVTSPDDNLQAVFQYLVKS